MPDRRRVLLGLLAALWLAVLPLGAQTPTPASDAAAREAIARLRSPYCPGLMLEVCPSPQAALLRDSIHSLAAAGSDADALVEWMIARHGEEWRALPKRSGTGMWAWIAPPLVLLGGGALLLERLRRSRGAAGREGAAEPLTEADRGEIRAALLALERDEP